MQSIISHKMARAFMLALVVIMTLAMMVMPVLANDTQESIVYGPMGCDLAGGGCTEFGTAELTRRSDRVHVKVNSSGLEEGGVYTLWFVVFNNPEFCNGPCDANDFGDQLVATSILWGTGSMVNSQGNAQFNAVLREGNAPGEVVSGPGLLDVEGAEIHIVLRTHGAPIPGLVPEQLTTFAGGCDINFCADQQFAIFP